MSKPFIGIPTHDNRICYETAMSLYATGTDNAVVSIKGMSLLSCNFNVLLCDCLNQADREGITHFCLLHSDIVPRTDGWLAKMLDIMRRDQLQILSVVSPIKATTPENEGAISCGLSSDTGLDRLTLDRLKDLPATFGRPECKAAFGNDRLVFNSGLLLVRLQGFDAEKCFFRMEDHVRKVAGTYHVACLPEDWMFSAMAMRACYKYAVTTEIELTHYGTHGWSNQL